MCSVLGVSTSGYYNWLNSTPSKRVLENKEIIKNIEIIYHASNKTYGSPMITKALLKVAIKVSRPRVARLMSESKIKAIRMRKFIVTTDSKHQYPVAENHLDRNFKCNEIGKAVVSDITYIPTKEGWLYLTTVIDLADRKVIGWALSTTMKASDTSVAAFQMAMANRDFTENFIFHSDRGVQYASTEFTTLLDKQGYAIRSMSRKGNCWDNAVAESFFKTIKCDLIYNENFNSIQDAKTAIFEYIEIWYNKKRMHSSLDYRTPQEMEEYLLNKNCAA